jgi:uncharacterized surface protein with fasciclin (FAS1) repeats
MKKLSIHVLLVALLLSVASINCGSGANLLKSGSSLMSALGKVPNLSQFTNLLQTPGLDKLLGGVMKKPFSLLAPTNDAMSGLASGAMGDVSKVADMVKNLIVPGKKDAASLMQSGVASAAGKPLDLSGVKLGDMISGDKFNIFPVDKIPGK